MSDGSLASPVVGDEPLAAPLLKRLGKRLGRRLAGWALPTVFVLLFVAVKFMPGVTSGSSTVNLADAALAALTIWAIVRVRREGFGALRGSLWLWSAILALLAYLVAASLYPTLSDPDYAWKTHLGTALKFAEYAVLVPVTAVLIRDEKAARRLWTVVALTAAVAGVIAVLQFFGVQIFQAAETGTRQPAFTGISVLGTLGAAAIAVGFVGVLWPGTLSRRVIAAGLVGGSVSAIFSGEAAAGISIALITVASLLLVRVRRRVTARQAAVVIGVTLACAVGMLTIRSGDISQFTSTIDKKAKAENVNTYSQRTLMLYIGLRIWEAHPLFGSGWESIREPRVYSPFLAAAHRRFPNQPEEAFPSAEHRWGVDNAYVQSLAELGIVGTAVLLAFLATGVGMGIRGALRAPPESAELALMGLLWLLVTIGIWAGQGLVAGTGFAALPFFGLGLIAAQRARARAT
ncbi:MAG TPA: O-antigen ligase family protein [Gaiellaceae bacterium]|nr:O-antigen ligase family protein [Gaiellaceae bacterium]